MGAGRVVMYVGDGLAHMPSALDAVEDWRSEHATTLAEAVDDIADVDCVVCEAALSDGSGLDLHEEVRRRRPEAAFVLLAAGRGDPELARAAASAGVTEYLPVATLSGAEELRAVVAEALSTVPAERRYSRLLEHTSDTVCVIDADGTVAFVDPTVESLLGHDSEAVTGADIAAFVHPDDHDDAREALAAAAAAPAETTAVTCRLQHADGTWQWVSARLRSRLDDPAVRGVVATVRDISERKAQERERELYETMLDTVPDGVYAVDDDGVFLALNDTAAEMCGYATEELVGRHVSTVMGEADIARSRELIAELLDDADREKAISEIDLRTGDGETIPVENHVALLRERTDDGGAGKEAAEPTAFRGSVGVFRDIRDRVEREHRLAVLNRALRHDLRNSMHVVMANAELVEEVVDDPTTRAKLRTIQRRAEQINTLGEKAREIEDILGGAERRREAVDLTPVLEDLVESFREAFPEATIDAEIPATVPVAATELVDVAVENLLENSLEHADDPAVELVADVDDGTVTVTVLDDGPGIPEKERRVVTKGSETPLDHASGLGLWLVAWITRDSGGEVVFEDCAEGSAVHLKLDRADPETVGPGDGDGDGDSGSADERVE